MEIKIEKVTISYKDVIAINNLSYSFYSGKIYGLIGPNGAGKSSLIKAMAGLFTEFNGNVFINDWSIVRERQRLRESIGYAPEDIDLIPYLTGEEYLQMIADLRKIKQPDAEIDSLIKMLGLEEVKHKLINRYSHGMAQKLSLAGALIGLPDILLLDEALNGFDPLSMYYTKKFLRETAKENRIIIISSHVLEIVEKWCDKILVLHHGVLLKDFSTEDIENWKQSTSKQFDDLFVEMIESYFKK